MALTVDHLRIDHRLTILREFTDAAGTTIRAGRSGILRGFSLDQIQRTSSGLTITSGRLHRSRKCMQRACARFDARATVAAFKLAVDWMWTHASWATSGGEGTALSYDRDQFHAALVREFGYDPTKNPP